MTSIDPDEVTLHTAVAVASEEGQGLSSGHYKGISLDSVRTCPSGPPQVDVNFGSSTFQRGIVPLMQPIDEANLEEVVADNFHNPTCFSLCARHGSAILAGLTGIGAIALCAKAKVIKPDEIGLARGFDGNVYKLTPGCNIATTFFREVKVFKQTNNIIGLHPVHIIRILPGHYGLCKSNGIPLIMAPGRHFINDKYFEYVGAVPATSPFIQNETISIIIVPTGKVGVCSVKGVGHLLEPGQHWINNPDFEFSGGFIDANAEYIRANAKHRVLIPVGKVGLGWKQNEGVLLEANRAYYIDDAEFRYAGSVSLLQERIEHGAFKIITVNRGLVGVAFDEGKLQILEAGRHVVQRETFNFSSMLSTGQETIPIAQITNLSSDNVGLQFSAALNVQVMDARKAVTMLGRDLSDVADTRTKSATEFSASVFQNNIRDRARLALSIIIGNNPFTETFLSTSALATDDDVAEQSESFKGIIHDAFMSKFSKEMIELCGVKVIDMSIEDIKIVNRELSHALAQAAVKATELEMAKIDLDVETHRAQTAVKSLKIRAEGEGAAMKVDANARAAEISIIADAEATRIGAIDAALANSCASSQSKELITATGHAVGATRHSIVVANDVNHLGMILSGIGGGKRPKK
mmetsp:Transcript_39295/g.57810  ORF Transcript_39295/g.57810 Transcript_39295/m.57810 type:complete len:636 (+) Transcript_39295:141-2048(+)|eukprot:CAMPEP_0195529488 /NCGR_PEP_ID=MMETSP0794_2-20130614/32041_1 /TAXON_ID=515487 /ORGANISM="Stephanopyxis turris, Strain CCMP 815" /LENGTH=635 /DNA_ID=CAMNT_0040660799 /DNA_START=134 /DNA_END=2041 /DNA_ORIENTATION=+